MIERSRISSIDTGKVSFCFLLIIREKQRRLSGLQLRCRRVLPSAVSLIIPEGLTFPTDSLPEIVLQTIFEFFVLR